MGLPRVVLMLLKPILIYFVKLIQVVVVCVKLTLQVPESSQPLFLFLYQTNLDIVVILFVKLKTNLL